MLHILSIDDDTDLQNRIKTYLERFIECYVEVLSSPAPAITDRILPPSDIIVCGDSVYGPDRIAFLKEIRSDFPYIPFIFLCGDISTDDLIEIMNSGCAYCVKKEDNPEEYLSQLANTVKKSWDHGPVRSHST